MMHNDCKTCGKCDSSIPSVSNRKEGDTLYTFMIYSENIAGLLSLITAVFTRRQVNIESLNVCASSTPGVHKYTITCYCDEEMAKMLTKQIEKKIDVIQASYFTDDEIFIPLIIHNIPHIPFPFIKAIRKRKLYKDCFMNYTEEEKK